jgi:hypothetical protein
MNIEPNDIKTQTAASLLGLVGNSQDVNFNLETLSGASKNLADSVAIVAGEANKALTNAIGDPVAHGEWFSLKAQGLRARLILKYFAIDYEYYNYYDQVFREDYNNGIKR